MGNRLCALLTVPAFKSRASSGYAAGNIRIGGEGKESNLPSPTRRDRPVLKTGGATGPLPSPLPGLHLTQRALSAEAAAASTTPYSQTSPSFPHLAAAGFGPDAPCARPSTSLAHSGSRRRLAAPCASSASSFRAASSWRVGSTCE